MLNDRAQVIKNLRTDPEMVMELLEALVEAVRARQWADAERQAQAWSMIGARPNRHTEYLATRAAAMARAVRLLERS